MERNIIQFKGIVRNTPGSSSEDGQFDEVQNLRFRDGAWRPVLDPLPLKGYEDGEHSKAGQYVTHYIHATGDYKHLLGINKDKLYWIADLVVPDDDHDEVVCKWKDEPQEIASCSKNARMVTNGNMCTFVSQEDFFHIFFRTSDSEQRYVVLGGMLTDGLSATEIKPDNAPALRVKGWVVDKDRYPEQWDEDNQHADKWRDIRNLKLTRVYQFDWGSGAGEGDFGSIDEVINSVKGKYPGRWHAIRNAEKKEGFLHGFFWACTALKMYDGTYILHSRPVLMQQAADEQIRFGQINLIGYNGHTYTIIKDDCYLSELNHFCSTDDRQAGFTVLNKGTIDLSFRVVGERNYFSEGEESVEYFSYIRDLVHNEDYGMNPIYAEQYYLNPRSPMLYTLGGPRQYVPTLHPFLNNMNEGDNPGLLATALGVTHGQPITAPGLFAGQDKTFSYVKTDIKSAANLTPNYMVSFGIGADVRFWSRGHEVCTTHNILQIRANKMIDDSYKDIVQSVAVFITPEIDGIDFNRIFEFTTKRLYNDNGGYTYGTIPYDGSWEQGDSVIRIPTEAGGMFQSSVIRTIVPSGYLTTNDIEGKVKFFEPYTLCPCRRPDTDIRKELLHQRNFYKVKEFTWDEYQKDVVNHGWVTIDLKDVLSTLTEQETLNIDSYTRSEYYSSVCQYYNGKLHIANYKENQFTGWPATYFKAEGYNYIAQDEEDKDREIGKSKGSIGDSADNDTNAVTFNKMRQDVTASNLQVQRDFYKHHDGTQTLEIGTAGVAEAAWRADGIVINESSLNTFFSKVKGYQIQIRVTVEDEDGNSRQFWRTTPLRYFSDLRLNAMLSFPDIRAKNMWIYTYVQFEARVGNRYADKWALLGSKSFDLDTDNGFNLAVYLSEDLRHIWAVDWKKLAKLVQGDYTGIALLDNPPSRTQTTISEYPNQLKVSEVNNPLYYPPENTYVVSNGSIQAMENDSISMQAGQYGTSPLYVFSSDGIYGLMVDASGELTYTNSRCVARDVVSDPHAIESTEAGVLFPTRHGLMSISNQVVTELSEPVEGPVVPWFDPLNIEKLPQAQIAAGLRGIRSNADEDGNPQPVFKFGDGALSHAEEEFKTFVQGAVIGYNYIDKEIWVSKRGQGTYVLTRSGWTRLSVEADKYVADFPHYYLQRDNRLYWLGREKTEETVTGEDGTAASKKLAASCYFITRPVKLGAEDYKQALRLVLRCRLECEEGQMSSLLVWGSYDSRKWTCLGGIDRVGSVKDIGKVVNRTDCKYFRFAFFGRLQAGSVIDYAELSSERRLYAGKIR